MTGRPALTFLRGQLLGSVSAPAMLAAAVLGPLWDRYAIYDKAANKLRSFMENRRTGDVIEVAPNDGQ